MKLIQTIPAQGIYHQQSLLNPGDVKPGYEQRIVNIYDDVCYQTLIGFGGSFTESSAYNYSLLTEAQKKEFMEAHFGENGLRYNFGRTHIASCDFSLDIYCHVQQGDKDLSTFSLARDKKYIIPFLKDAMRYSGEPIMLFASPWSPPAYMKENESAVKGGCIKEEYKALWARYYCRYIREMENEGIEIFAITVQNEPKAIQTWESCSYTAAQEGEFIEQYLAPALDEAGLSHIKIMIWDHNKERVYDRARDTLTSPAVNQRVWAVAHHWYSGDHFEGLRLVHEQLGKTLISSEICAVIDQDVNQVAERYGIELCGNFNNYSAAFCDWNMLLTETGGPYHNRNKPAQKLADGTLFEDKGKGCYAPVLYNTEKKELVFTPIYHYIKHFSQYIRRGAVRVATTNHDHRLHSVAFRNPDGQLVLVMVNPTDDTITTNLRLHDQITGAKMPPHSIATVLF
jgi:glucosylceramidase